MNRSFGLRAVLFAAAAAALIAVAAVAASTPPPVDISTFASTALDWALQPSAEGTAGLAMITPTIGRRVWLWPNGVTHLGSDKPLAVINGPGEPQPLDAGVVFVWNDRMVNLDVADHYGQHHPATSVRLLQDDDPIPTSGAYATWMPYQKAQVGSPIDPSNTVKAVDPQPTITKESWENACGGLGTKA